MRFILSFLLFAVCGFLTTSLMLKTSAQSPQQQMGGSSTGEAKTYSSKRTVNITDASAPLVFEDLTARTPLKNFAHVSGDGNYNYIVDTTSGGVAVFDYDNDGKPDVYLLNGATFDAVRGKSKHPRAALYRNLGDWKFEDVTEKAGVANERWGMGVAVGDYNNDGFLDLYVGNFGVSRLYKNNGDGTFTDVAERLGVARKGWSTGATIGDYDADGRPDIFVPGYVQLDINNLPPNPAEAGKPGKLAANFCQFRGVPVMCGPRGLKGEGDTLYRQKPDGTFEDVTAKAGVGDPDGYYGFSSAFVHVNDDDLLDLIVVNDSTPKLLYINKGDGTFEETGYPSGVALNENGREQAGMGLAIGDYNNDAQIDFYITNFSDDSNTLYRNDGDGNFTDITFQAGMGEPTIPFLGWGTSFVDYDNDGWQDVLVANGHVYPAVDNYQWGTTFAQQLLLFRNNGKSRFERVGAKPKSGLADAWSTRGLGLGDLDNDGKVDAVLNNINSAPTVLQNVFDSKNHWLIVKLAGDNSKRTPRDAVGSVVYVTSGNLRRRFDVISGAGYASQNDLRLHIGLGANPKIDKLEVKWTNGMREIFNVETVDRTVTLTQGKGAR